MRIEGHCYLVECQETKCGGAYEQTGNQFAPDRCGACGSGRVRVWKLIAGEALSARYLTASKLKTHERIDG